MMMVGVSQVGSEVLAPPIVLVAGPVHHSPSVINRTSPQMGSSRNIVEMRVHSMPRVRVESFQRFVNDNIQTGSTQ